MEKKLVRGYFEKENVVGDIVFANYIDGKVILRDGDDEEYTAKFEDVVELESLGFIGGVEVFNHDVIVNQFSCRYELVKNKGDGKIDFYYVNDEYERTTKYPSDFTVGLERISTNSKVEGNVFVLRNNVPKVDLDFNIKVYKDITNGATTYLYACNNKNEEEIDLIKVIYIGHYLLEEEDYFRHTVNYEAFKKLVLSETIVEVSPMELLNFTTNQTKKAKEELYEESESIWEDGDYECDDCEDEYEDTDYDLDWEEFEEEKADKSLNVNAQIVKGEEYSAEDIARAISNMKPRKFTSNIVCDECEEDILDCDCGELF